MFKKYFKGNLEPAVQVENGPSNEPAVQVENGPSNEPAGKTFGNTTASGAKKNVKDIEFWGNGDLFKLISKAWSKDENWMKSTKAMQINGVGCIVQITTQQGDNVSEAVAFAPGTRIEEFKDSKGKVVSREIVGR